VRRSPNLRQQLDHTIVLGAQQDKTLTSKGAPRAHRALPCVRAACRHIGDLAGFPEESIVAWIHTLKSLDALRGQDINALGRSNCRMRSTKKRNKPRHARSCMRQYAR